MKAYHDFIIKSDFAFAKSFTTESGLELQADARFSADRLANRIATVIELPISFENCEIKKGYQVMVDPTIFYQQDYIGGVGAENSFMVDKAKGIYKISPSMIVLYRKNENDEWKGYDESIMVEFEKQVIPEVKIGTIVIEKEKSKTSEQFATVLYSNKGMIENDVKNNHRVVVKKGFGVSFWIEGKEYSWINNRHVLAKIN